MGSMKRTSSLPAFTSPEKVRDLNHPNTTKNVMQKCRELGFGSMRKLKLFRIDSVDNEY